MLESLFNRIRASNKGKIPFEDTIASLKNRLWESKYMAADLLFMSTYMASITTSQASRPEIFSFTAERREYAPARYIGKVENFVKKVELQLCTGTYVCCRESQARDAPEFHEPVCQFNGIRCAG